MLGLTLGGFFNEIRFVSVFGLKWYDLIGSV